MRVAMATEKFDRNNVSVTIVHHPNGSEQVIEINRRPIWGTDGGLPRTRYASITIEQGKKKLTLPDEAIGDLFQPNLDSTKVFHDPKTKTTFITALNSDGAGGYAVAFKIVDGKYVARHVLGPF